MDKNGLFKMIIACCILILFAGLSIFPQVVVSHGMFNRSGNTLYVGGVGLGNYSSIQDAIDNATDGDTVYVYDDSAPYSENVVIDRSINLVGETVATTIIDGGADGNVIHVTADGVNISGFKIQNSGSEVNIAGIFIDANNNRITGNALVNNYHGIILNDLSDSNLVSGNTVVGHTVGGISLWNATNNTVSENNVIGNNFWGVYLEYSTSNEILANTISNHGHGIYLLSSSSNRIGGNTIEQNSGGFYLVYSDENHLFRNIIAYNPYGLELDYSNDNIICGSTISHSDQYGVEIADFPSTNNIFYHNSFISNLWDALDQYTNTWDNGYPSGGNYWDDYTGTDGNGDGIGDTPYPIMGGSNIDWYPLMEQWIPPPCGEVTHNGIIDIGDIVYLINYLYKNGPAPIPFCIGDVTVDGIIDISDVVYLINYLYKGGPAPRDDCCEC